MSEQEFIWKMRVKIFHDPTKKVTSTTKLCKKYGASRSWYYKWKKRRDRLGEKGSLPVRRTKPKMPNQISEEIEAHILNFVKEYPTYGPERIEAEFKSCGIWVA